MQADFVGEQARAWCQARPQDRVTILAPHDASAAKREVHDRLSVERFQYVRPATWQKLAYPAILPNIRRNPILALQLPFFFSAQYRAARDIVKREGIDLVYAHWVMPQGLVAWWLKRKFGIPYVLQNHSSDLTVFDKGGKGGRRIARRLLRDASHFFCVNSLQREHALSLFEGAERDGFAQRCSVMPMGVATPQQTATGPKKYDIGTIGRLSAKKGIHFLLEASERLAGRGSNFKVGVAGDGEQAEALKGLVDGADIDFVGFVDAERKDAFFADTARFAFPAKASEGDVEGLPVSLLEALCRGMPVLASRDTNIELLPEWPTLRDMVVFVEDPGEQGAFDQAMVRLLEMDAPPNPQLVELMARYRWDRLIEPYLEPIETIVTAESE